MPPKTRRTTRAEASSSRATRAEAPTDRAPRERARTPRRSRRRQRSPTPPLSPLPWPLATSAQEERYRVLHRRKVLSSKFFCPYTMRHLGIYDEVHTYLARIGWTQFASIQMPTYKAVTYEILSTLHADYNRYDHRDQPCIFFRCLGLDRSLSMAQFNAIFGFPDEGITWFVPNFRTIDAWGQLSTESGSDYSASHSKSSCLHSHALRYIHRVMAHSIFGRGLSTGVVNRGELLFLWAMVNNVQVNTGAWILQHLLHVAKMPSGKICVGGILSVIAHAVGFVPIPEIHRTADGSHLVDIETLMHMRICRALGQGRYRLIDDAGHVIEPEEEEDEEQPFEADDPLLPEDAQFEEQMPEHQPDMEGFDMGGQNQDVPPPPPSYAMHDIVERLERLETTVRQGDERHAAFQAQILEMMQRQEEHNRRQEEHNRSVEEWMRNQK